MVARGYGRVVNGSSAWGAFSAGMGGPGMYGVPKAALKALTVRLATELPPTVKVKAMDPGGSHAHGWSECDTDSCGRGIPLSGWRPFQTRVPQVGSSEVGSRPNGDFPAPA